MNHARYIIIGGSAGAVCGLGYKYGIVRHRKEAIEILKYASVAGTSGAIAGFFYANWMKRPRLAYSASLGFNGAVLAALFFSFRKITDHTDIANINQLETHVKTAGSGGLTLFILTAISGGKTPALLTSIIGGAIIATCAHTGYDAMLLLRRKAALAYHTSQLKQSTETQEAGHRKSVIVRGLEYLGEPTETAMLDLKIRYLYLQIRSLEIELGDISDDDAPDVDSKET